MDSNIDEENVEVAVGDGDENFEDNTERYQDGVRIVEITIVENEDESKENEDNSSEDTDESSSTDSDEEEEFYDYEEEITEKEEQSTENKNNAPKDGENHDDEIEFQGTEEDINPKDETTLSDFVLCPNSNCENILEITGILSHFVRNIEKGPLKLQESLGEDEVMFRFYERVLEFGKTVCLGILCYGGLFPFDCMRPAFLGQCKPNSSLPPKYSYLKNHLPIFIMGCKTALASRLKNKELIARYTNPLYRKRHILVLWLAAGDTTKTVRGKITVFDKEMTTSHKATVKTRNFRESHQINDFLWGGKKVLILNRDEMDTLSARGRDPIYMEIQIRM